MVFSSLAFLFFFLPAVLAGYFALPWRAWRNGLLFGASLVFYAWGEPVYVALMLGSIGFNWAAGLLIGRLRRWSRAILAGGIAVNLAGLAAFKYAGFFAANARGLLGVDLGLPAIALPIGISFYTFQAISYLVDVHRRVVEPRRNPLYFGTYLAMFSQLIAGPIVRYATIADDLDGRRETLELFGAGLRRFIVGLGKKVILANTMGAIADAVIGAGPEVGMLGAWTGFVAYAFQIYFDFSAYSDMAIGIGMMFGFRFLENFNHPYVARSITDFWRRWHISLSSFFRDYVYIPLGGNRVGRARWVANLLVVWGLTGLWHGASWNFVLWGLYYGLLLLGEKLLWGRLLARLPAVLQHGYVILGVLFSWVLFRIEDAGEIGRWLGALAGAQGLGHPASLNALNVLHKLPWLAVAAVASTPLVAGWFGRFGYLLPMDRQGGLPRPAAGAGWCFDGALAVVLAWSVIELILGGFNPFIYYRF